MNRSDKIFVEYNKPSTIYPDVSAFNSDGKLLIRDNLAFVMNWLRKNGYINVIYEYDIDKFDWVKEAIEKAIESKCSRNKVKGK